ncbi:MULTISPECIES: hypothetical protein [Phocaeicola]|uniref:hypothetical protein n=1 Tax=Phocaeicola TaxID=909656 RepID=UPI00146FEF79|nr:MULTISPECIES: hypothetical protein [Phocaeicola]MBT9849651.1 hypothetical protein [Phocaeicola vulgatus]MCB6663901.1 hypothetical protein [Phocaeicola dorei]MCS3022243.1 hypothetical protein [Phocaeicola vulgatus]MCS3143845.1 hypothetical protein [Phocaeicola vulgatus]NMW73829.1 hypothetical protein [Phocaeicola vulgatus]
MPTVLPALSLVVPFSHSTASAARWKRIVRNPCGFLKGYASLFPVYSRIIQVEIRERDGGVTCNGFAGIL